MADGKDETLQAWLKRRSPELPPVFLPYLDVGVDTPFRGPLQLEEAGAQGILRALRQPGRCRPAAFDLLAGDAHLTYACESLAQGEGTGEGLKGLLARLGERFR